MNPDCMAFSPTVGGQIIFIAVITDTESEYNNIFLILFLEVK